MKTPVKIIRIPILPMHMVNSHLLIGPDGCVLMDTGVPGSEEKVQRILKREGLTFRDIKLIIVTHAHIDHAGSAARLRELTQAPILAHEKDAKHYSQETPMTFCPTGWAGRVLLRNFITRPYTGFAPDVIVSGKAPLSLESYGIPGQVTPTPGHTSGSISVELDSKEAFVGDLVASGILLGGIMRKKHAIRPPFEDNPHQVARELQRLLASGHEHFHVGHGGPLKAEEVRKHAQSLLKLPYERTEP
ncbi:MBL fold metallo-hydrolase [Marinicrinis sediminis]|uniref:MBL fold metallo-hydrolase n=1 Tax=Marinicrinis sediminis TaxID=1652465 RepID=A0ABW5R5I9_9BACL